MENELRISDIIQAIAILALIVSIIIQYCQMNKQLRIQNHQLIQQNEQTKLDFFADYTKRYQDIIWHLPSSIYDDDFSLSSLDIKEREHIKKAILLYFDLCSEEYYLHENKKIDDAVWAEWEEGIMFNMSKPAFNGIWKKKLSNSSYYTKFKEYLNQKLNINPKDSI